MGATPRDPFVRQKFTRERTAAKKLAAEYFQRFRKERYQTEVESWRNLQSQNIEFTMKRLRERSFEIFSGVCRLADKHFGDVPLP